MEFVLQYPNFGLMAFCLVFLLAVIMLAFLGRSLHVFGKLHKMELRLRDIDARDGDVARQERILTLEDERQKLEKSIHDTKQREHESSQQESSQQERETYLIQRARELNQQERQLEKREQELKKREEELGEAATEEEPENVAEANKLLERVGKRAYVTGFSGDRRSPELALVKYDQLEIGLPISFVDGWGYLLLPRSLRNAYQHSSAPQLLEQVLAALRKILEQPESIDMLQLRSTREEISTRIKNELTRIEVAPPKRKFQRFGNPLGALRAENTEDIQ